MRYHTPYLLRALTSVFVYKCGAWRFLAREIAEFAFGSSPKRARKKENHQKDDDEPMLDIEKAPTAPFPTSHHGTPAEDVDMATS